MQRLLRACFRFYQTLFNVDGYLSSLDFWCIIEVVPFLVSLEDNNGLLACLFVDEFERQFLVWI